MAKNTYNIKEPEKELLIERAKIENGIDYPVFCFKHLHLNSIKKGKGDIFKDFLFRMQKLCETGWTEIHKAPCHGLGYELLDRDKFHYQLPNFITPDIKKLHVFRASGNNLPFVAHKNGNVLHVIFLEIKFNEIYDHGKSK